MTVTISGTGSHVPETVLGNTELASRVGVVPQWITDKTGIRERRVAAPGEATSDLAALAASRALAAARLDAADVDLLVLATSTPDQPMPATACHVQALLGATRAAAFDVDAVCSGFVYAFVVAHAMLLADPARTTALVIGADTYSRVLDYSDRRTAVLFGDGAGAVVLRKTPDAGAVLATTLSSDGSTADLVKIPAGGSREPASADTVARGRHFFTMHGGDVRRLAAKMMPAVVSDLLDATGLRPSDIDLLVPHQANGVMLADLAAGLELHPGTMHLTVARFGNTGAASIPLTLDDAVQNGRLSPGSTVFLVAFGGGMTWGGVALRWSGTAGSEAGR
ncbi:MULTISPECIES: 3-oxoacyl-ACP synthase III family protein [Amycolatopsis]|uniref:3-oxoacyl-[acyl-carrier-protein] synthase-3 n=2 Tax=Amycolatopsis TaxID=1813 RepID=A0A1I3WQ07_9PSEU|nr:beta-ketoacyl-ACP synthase 3 [Amycolatopsis sacchari]SFK09595.1 3-oxoacyl-[acyl-carrier-protein] synthase-3 [Amycolatopsis sacchari]